MSKVRKSKSRSKANPLLPAVIPTNLLPPMAGDDQENVLPREGQINGLKLDIRGWGAIHESEEIEVFLHDRSEPIYADVFSAGTPMPDPLKITVNSQYLRTHGHKEIYYRVTNLEDGNDRLSERKHIFVDALDPNLNDYPKPVELPAELNASKVLTPELLSNLGNKVTLAIPDPVDRRPGDTYKFYWGSGLPVPTATGTVPNDRDDPIVFELSDTQIELLGEGYKVLQYIVTDRAGNPSRFSIPDTIQVLLSDPPSTLPAPNVPAAEQFPGDYIDREEARSGVQVEIPRYDNAQGGDRIILLWHGTRVSPDQELDPLPVFPLEFTVPYSVVASFGADIPYRAKVEYAVERGGVPYTSLPKYVDVDLVVPGDPIVGPGPVDPSLALPVVSGNSSPPDNILTQADHGFNARMHFPLPDNLSVDDEIEGFYGPGDGYSLGTYEVTGNEGPGFTVGFDIEWDSVISVVGNGLIPCWYKVSNDRNFKLSQKQEVQVNVNDFDITELVEFTRKNAQGVINCDMQPWLGIPVRILAPSVMEVNDEIELVVKGYDWLFTQDLSGEAQIIPHTVRSTDIANGVNLTINFYYFVQDNHRFGIEAFWRIRKAVGGGGGTSPVNQVRVSVLRPGGGNVSCAP